LRHEKHGRSRLYVVDRARLARVREWLSWFDAPA
jgi:hypothetical protein